MLDFPKDCDLKIIKDLVEGDTSLSRIFGFILYTDKDPYVAKVLEDEYFWKALDAISGSNWPIFAARPLKKGFREYRGGGAPDSFSMMVSVWNEPKTNYQVLKYFDLDNSEDLPLFVAFIWDDQDDLKQIAIPIRGTTVDTVYASLKEIVELISKVENDITPDNKQSVQVFNNVKVQLESLKWKYNAKQRVKAAFKILDYVKMFW